MLDLQDALASSTYTESLEVRACQISSRRQECIRRARQKLETFKPLKEIQLDEWLLLLQGDCMAEPGQAE